MAYYPPNYYPQYYGTQNASQMVSNAQQGASGNLVWVQGEASAKAYPVASGQSVLLMDSEDSVMYIKSTDQSGMPQPLRIFDYKERTQAHNSPTQPSTQKEEYVSRKEFEAFRDDVRREIKGIRYDEEAEG